MNTRAQNDLASDGKTAYFGLKIAQISYIYITNTIHIHYIYRVENALAICNGSRPYKPQYFK